MKMDTGLDIAGDRRAEFVADANAALHLKLVRRRADLSDDSVTFHPEMSHQVYGDSESIYGYAGLAVQLYYTAGRLTTYAGYTYKTRAPCDAGDTQPDQVLQPLAAKLQRPFCANLDAFAAAVDSQEERAFQPPGRRVHSFDASCRTATHRAGSDDDGQVDAVRQFEVFACDAQTPGLCDLHERLQTFLLWFVDAASFIDVDDERWRFWLCFERYRDSDTPDGAWRYALAGYVTVYEYYAYPSHVRPRVSQMLVLPPFQRRGVGAQLLQCVYRTYVERQDVLDVTVEDASDEFVRLRDFVDCQRVRQALADVFAGARLTAGFGKEMSQAARSRLKMPPQQTRRIYEILRLAATNVHDKKQYESYRLDVKRRLFAPFHKEDVQLDKLRRVLRPQELAITVTSKQQRHESLERLYTELEQQYNHTLKSLALQ